MNAWSDLLFPDESPRSHALLGQGVGGMTAESDEINPVLPHPRSQLVLQIQEEPVRMPSVCMVYDAEQVGFVVVQEVFDLWERYHLASGGYEDIWRGILGAPQGEHLVLHDFVRV